MNITTCSSFRFLTTLLGLCLVWAAGAAAAAPAALPSLDVDAYMGRWYQVALYPNRFQSQCLSDTSATYRLVPGGVEVTNQCTTKDGPERVVGMARPRGSELGGGMLKPASLEVAFAPTWLRWLPLVWGNYDVVHLTPDKRLAIVSEPSQSYLWVLSRERSLSDAQWQAVERYARDNGFDWSRVQREIHRAAP